MVTTKNKNTSSPKIETQPALRSAKLVIIQTAVQQAIGPRIRTSAHDCASEKRSQMGSCCDYSRNGHYGEPTPSKHTPVLSKR